MTKSFKAKFIQHYVAEIFGSQTVVDPLIAQNLSQRTKYHLKKLGLAFNVELKAVVAQIQELQDKYCDKVQEGEDQIQYIPKQDTKEEYELAVKELEDMDISMECFNFTERDFIDRNTGDIVAGKTYYNVIDILLWEEEEKKIEKSELHAV